MKISIYLHWLWGKNVKISQFLHQKHVQFSLDLQLKHVHLSLALVSAHMCAQRSEMSTSSSFLPWQSQARNFAPRRPNFCTQKEGPIVAPISTEFCTKKRYFCTSSAWFLHWNKTNFCTQWCLLGWVLGVISASRKWKTGGLENGRRGQEMGLTVGPCLI